MNMKKADFAIILGSALLLTLTMTPVSALYNFDGFPLNDHLIAEGTINGGVYVGGGHGLETTPYTESFSVPNGTIIFARLYTHVWGTDDGIGWVNTTFNGESLGNLTLRNKDDTNPTVYCAGPGGTYWVHYNVTDKVVAGAMNDAIVNTGDIYSFDGRVDGVVLIAVYEDASKPQVRYWIQEGLDLLHYGAYGHPPRNSATTTFPGEVANESVKSATLWMVYHAANEGDNDKLRFNDHLLATDAANESSGPYFDLKAFNVTDYLIAYNNTVKYDRGDDTYLYPANAILICGKMERQPDLMVEEIKDPSLLDHLTTYAAVVNHTYIINSTIKNIGDADADGFDVTLQVNETATDTAHIAGLTAKNSKTVSFTWTPASSGYYVINITADISNDVNESIESNNYKMKNVSVYPEGMPDLIPGDILFLPTKDSNATTISVRVDNNGTGDANNFKVELLIDGTPIANNTLSVGACAAKLTSFEYDAAHGSHHDVEIILDPDDIIDESNETNNTATGSFDVIRVEIMATKNYNKEESLFDVVKLVPEGAKPFDVLQTVADVNTDNRTYPYVYGINGIDQDPNQNIWWVCFINGYYTKHYFHAESPEYFLHDGEVINWVFPKSVYEGDKYWKPHAIMHYPEPFAHGYNGTVHDTTIVYPTGYEGIVNSIKGELVEHGVPANTINIVSVGSVTSYQKENTNLILIGPPTENEIIADVNTSFDDIGMTVYFNNSMMIDAYTDRRYSTAGVVEAFDNPYDNPPGEEYLWKDTGPVIWIVSGTDKNTTVKASELLINRTDELSTFWEVVLLPETMADLTVKKISIPKYIFSNLSNEIKAVISNDGVVDAAEFDVGLSINGTEVDKEYVEELGAGANTTVSFNWVPSHVGDYLMNITADINDTVSESNETNNVNSTTVHVYENGCAGRQLETYEHDEINGDLIYTMGNSSYVKLEVGSITTFRYNLTISDSTSVKTARLYIFWYRWGTKEFANLSVNFSGNEVAINRIYTDTKGFGSYDYPGGSYVYDVTSLVSGTGTYDAVIKNVGTKYVGMYGAGLLVVYEDSSKPWIEYWVDEGCDMIYNTTKADYTVTAEEATTNASFAGSLDLGAINNATLYTIVAGGEKGKNVLFFNDASWDGVYNESSSYDTTVDKRNVKEALKSSENLARIRDTGDYMRVYNAFLAVEKTFGTGEGTYPSIMGVHKGNFTAEHNITVHKMYTYPCIGTGGHSEYVAFYNATTGEEIANGTWKGYSGDYHYITFDIPFELKKNVTYKYEIRTGSYPQIHHRKYLQNSMGNITCSEFIDANGKKYEDWIPAIRLE